MKFAALLLLLASGISFASVGPGPFRNDSPLVSGIDGTYQATAKAGNLMGVFKFAIRSGVQTETASQNSWIFFIEGNIYKGLTTAAIRGQELSGVLDGIANLGTNNNQATLPLYIFGGVANGDFDGTISLMNPEANFRGDGTIQTSDTNTVLLTYVGDVVTYLGGTGSNATFITNTGSIQVRPNVNDPIGTRTFKFKGIRTSVLSSGSTN